MTRPNILWICTDQQRWDTIRALGATAAQTPHLDRLTEEGTAFTRAYCQSPICTPSRSSFLTGMYPAAHQVQRNGNAYFPDHLTLVPQIFRDAGYRTGLIGKLHLSAAQNRIETRPERDGYEEFYWSQHPGNDWPEGHDYADWLAERGQSAAAFDESHDLISHPVAAEHSQVAWAADRALSFIDRADGRPWMLTINVYDPHPPFDPPKSWYDRFDPADMPPPVFAESDLAHHHRLKGVDQQTQTPGDPMRLPDPGAPEAATHDSPPERYDVLAVRAAYYAMVAMVDDMVGQLLDRLDASGQRQDTLILFMSDHGEMLGDHGLLYKGCRFYEGLVHVPMILSQPGRVQQGVKATGLAELVDIPATLCDAAGLTVPAQNQGRSLWPVLTGQAPTDEIKPYVLCEYHDALAFPGSTGSRGSMYFDGRHKLVVYHDLETGELFDLAADPGELHDLWTDEGSAGLRAELVLKHFSAMMRVTGAGPERVANF
ncbi:sulfatase [Salipiger abyssi]|uniref:Arylsulfatase A family protein n=1 Tax=Salipiger abyssi TaxID=1250539 RepID=A0A1P8UN90_9RHOB|nr:sulfatase-like hydrolase/transferase [Salipiger abyssi]APZ50828.1 arylsulfatase A family protein [Salipiger abyssi]